MFSFGVIMQATEHTMEPTRKQHGSLSTLLVPSNGAKNTFFCLFLSVCLIDTHSKGSY